MKYALRALLLACALSPALAFAQDPRHHPCRRRARHRQVIAPATPAPAGGAMPAHPAAAASSRYSDEASAKTACTTDPVVWVNSGSKAFHTSGSRYYGKTKRGAYMCESQATAAGFHAVRGEK